jgi:uncharacterized SAM-binding protein YcdF (DUF218 family)
VYSDSTGQKARQTRCGRFRKHNMPVSGIDVVTEDLHARRTRLLFQKALGDKVAVGVIAIPNPDYDAKHWWRYSAGVKDVVSEAAAYVYATRQRLHLTTRERELLKPLPDIGP